MNIIKCQTIASPELTHLVSGLFSYLLTLRGRARSRRKVCMLVAGPRFPARSGEEPACRVDCCHQLVAELAVLAANDSNGEMRRHSPFTFGEGPSPGFFDHFSTQWSSSRVNKQAAADFRKKPVRELTGMKMTGSEAA